MTRSDKFCIVIPWSACLLLLLFLLFFFLLDTVKAQAAQVVEDNYLIFQSQERPYSSFGIHCYNGGTNWGETQVCNMGFNMYSGGPKDLTKPAIGLGWEYNWLGLFELNLDTWNTVASHRILAIGCGNLSFTDCAMNWQGYFGVRSTAEYEAGIGSYTFQVCVRNEPGCPKRGAYAARLHVDGSEFYVDYPSGLLRRCPNGYCQE